MTTTLRSSVAAQLGWTWNDRAGTSLITDSNRLRFDQDLADGDAAGEANAVWHADNQTLVAGQAVTLELDALEQRCFGDTIIIPFAKIKAILIVNTSSGGGYLQIGGAAADEWYAPFGASGDTIKAACGGPLLLSNLGDGWPVEAGSTALKITAVGGDAAYDIAILGTLLDQSGSSSGQ